MLIEHELSYFLIIALLCLGVLLIFILWRQQIRLKYMNDDKVNSNENNRKVFQDVPNISVKNTGKVYVEKIDDNGEDAEPLATPIGNCLLLAVSDGLGGAGSQKVDCNGIFKSKAYVASREALECTKKFFTRALTDVADYQITRYLFSDFEVYLKKHFKGLLDSYPSGESKIKSSLIKNFPTTIAGCLVEGSENQVTVHSFWAGDSRCYLQTKGKGLQQLSNDDLNSEFDAFENLAGDSRMSNFINSDKDFSINYKKVVLDEPFFIVVTTDGAFDYLPTPMHFEKLLVDSIMSSESLDDMMDHLEKELIEIPVGDDVSLSVLYVGWRDFNEIKLDLRDRRKQLQSDYISEIDELGKEIHLLKAQKQNIETVIKNKQEILVQKKQESWNKYKLNYHKN